MKFLVLFIAVLSFQNFASGKKGYEKIGEFLTVMLDAIDDYHGCVSQRYAIRNETDKAIKCIENFIPNGPFCEMFTKNFKTCVSPLLEQVQDCGEPSERGLKTALIDSIIAEFKFLCNTDGEHLLEFLNPCAIDSYTKNIPCLRKNLYVSKRAHEEAEDQANGLVELSVVGNLCRQLIDGEIKCFYEKFNTECTNPITIETFHKFLDMKVEPCNYVLKHFFLIYQFAAWLI